MAQPSAIALLSDRMIEGHLWQTATTRQVYCVSKSQMHPLHDIESCNTATTFLESPTPWYAVHSICFGCSARTVIRWSFASLLEQRFVRRPAQHPVPNCEDETPLSISSSVPFYLATTEPNISLVTASMDTKRLPTTADISIIPP